LEITKDLNKIIVRRERESKILMNFFVLDCFEENGEFRVRRQMDNRLLHESVAEMLREGKI